VIYTGRTPLFYAVLKGVDFVVGYLLSRNADVTITDYDNRSPLDIATGSTKLLIEGTSATYSTPVPVPVLTYIARAVIPSQTQLTSNQLTSNQLTAHQLTVPTN
jgi:hypothetical protein